MVFQAMGGRWSPTCGMQFSCFVLLIIILETPVCCALNSEGSALFQFRAKLDFDPLGALSNWKPDDSDPCMWSGIECVDGYVVMVNLNGLELEGLLAPELGNLSHLRYLDLSKNHLFGTIPPQFGQLMLLEVLDLRDNNLSGTVPAELGGLHCLRRLLLCNNRFEGSIPVEIEKLRWLTDLRFDGILTTTDAAAMGCANRKFGHCIWPSVSKEPKKSDISQFATIWSIPRYLNLLPQFSFGSESFHSHADDGYINLTDSPEQGAVQNTHKEVNSVKRRVLVEQSSNLVAIPPNSGAPPPSETGISIPSRSSGSFPAIPNRKKVSPAPVPTGQENKPHETSSPGSVGQQNDKQDGNWLKLIIGVSSAIFLVIVVAVMLIIFRSRAARTIGPWKSGLSGQLQKAFVTGVPKLNRGELETACEDFSNIIRTDDGVATLYKGTLSSGVEIAVASTAIVSINEWSKRAELAYRKKIDSLSRVNHKNFVNLLGFCEEDAPFTRMMVFEYAPNGSLFEHLHVKELEHLDWSTRMRIIMGTAYCLQFMHDLNPPVAHFNLTSKEILLTDDYAAKISDVAFWQELVTKSKNRGENESEHSELPPLADVETNVHSFGMLLLEIISGKLPYSEEHGNLLNWVSMHFTQNISKQNYMGDVLSSRDNLQASQYMNDKATIKTLVDPTLKSFKDDELASVCEAIQSCTQQDARRRPSMKEVIEILRHGLDISPEAATPRLSPLWWAELEILSAEAP